MSRGLWAARRRTAAQSEIESMLALFRATDMYSLPMVSLENLNAGPDRSVASKYSLEFSSKTGAAVSGTFRVGATQFSLESFRVLWFDADRRRFLNVEAQQIVELRARGPAEAVELARQILIAEFEGKGNRRVMSVQ